MKLFHPLRPGILVLAFLFSQAASAHKGCRAAGLIATNAKEEDTLKEKKDPLIMLQFAGGLSMPLGDFGRKIFIDERSGFANNGYAVQAQAVIKVNRILGFLLSYHSQVNAFDNDAFVKHYELQSPGASFNCSSTPWKVNGLFGGIYLTTPMHSERFSLYFQVEAGNPKHFLPQVSVTASNGNALFLGAGTARGLSFSTTLGLKYNFPENISIGLQAALMRSDPLFSGITGQANGKAVTRESYRQKILTQNFQLSLSILLAE